MCLELFSERAREVRENRTFAGRGIIHVCQVIDFSCTRNTRMDAKPPRQPYPSDLIDTEWTLLQPLLLPPQPGGGTVLPTCVRSSTPSSISPRTAAAGRPCLTI